MRNFNLFYLFCISGITNRKPAEWEKVTAAISSAYSEQRTLQRLKINRWIMNETKGASESSLLFLQQMKPQSTTDAGWHEDDRKGDADVQKVNGMLAVFLNSPWKPKTTQAIYLLVVENQDNSFSSQ